MNKLDFFTPVRYDGQEKNIKHHIFEGIEDYFSLGGKKACVIPSKIVDGSQEVELKHGSESKAKKVILGAIKVVSYMTGIIPLIMLVAKAIFRSAHKFHEVPSVVLLNNGVTLTESTAQKVQSVMDSVLKREESNGVKLYSGRWNHRIFSVDSEPNVIFKMVPDGNKAVEERYNRMVLAKTVCRTHRLGLLVIPGARKFEVEHEGKKYTVIAEEKVEINPKESAQEKNYHDHAVSLNEIIRQLAVFICKTGFSDMEWRNAPVVENSLDKNGNRKIALIDLEEMKSAKDGLFGCLWPSRRGLVECVNEEQGKIVVNEAKKHLSWSSSLGESAERSLKRRKDEVEDGVKLKEFYSTHNIQNGDEQIIVGQEGLDFSDFRKSEKLKQLATDLIDEINKRAAESSPEKSVKGRRYVYINTNPDGTPFSHMDRSFPDDSKGWSYEDDDSYLGIVVKKLVELGHIYKLIKRNGHGYFMQA